MKKSLFFGFIVSLVFAGFALGQDNPCKGKRLIGFEVLTSGFKNQIEAQKLSAAVVNMDIVDAQWDYCFVPTAGPSERQLVVKSSYRLLGSDRVGDEMKPQLYRSGGRIAASILIPMLPRKMRTEARRTVRQYVREPNIKLYQYQVTTVATMYDEAQPGSRRRNILWQGSASRIFLVRKVDNPGAYSLDKVEIYSGGDAGELVPYGVVSLPGSTNLQDRAGDIMRFLVTMDALQPRNVINGGQVLLAQK